MRGIAEVEWEMRINKQSKLAFLPQILTVRKWRQYWSPCAGEMVSSFLTDWSQWGITSLETCTKIRLHDNIKLPALDWIQKSKLATQHLVQWKKRLKALHLQHVFMSLVYSLYVEAMPLIHYVWYSTRRRQFQLCKLGREVSTNTCLQL